MPLGERRWYVVGNNERKSHKTKVIAKELRKILTSEPHFHDVRGTCQWQLVMPELYRRAVVGTIEIGMEQSPC